jgi:5-methylcytosine-specific restriction protein B
MADYFTSDHFKLLNRWKGQKRDESNPEQNRAYEDLKNAYEVTESWADKVKAELFPVGRVEIRKRPTNQGNNFASYNWAKIYPSPEAPKELAYTVGIGADDAQVPRCDAANGNRHGGGSGGRRGKRHLRGAAPSAQPGAPDPRRCSVRHPIH